MTLPSVTGATCEPLADQDYAAALRQTIQAAQRRCMCSIFIIDLKTRCVEDCVSKVVDDLEEARWRGVDVRVLIGGSRSTFAIAESAAIAVAQLSARGIPARWVSSDAGARGSHAKTLVADDAVLLGSHNWTPGAFRNDSQDSVRINSAALSEHFARQFEDRWRQGGGTGG